MHVRFVKFSFGFLLLLSAVFARGQFVAFNSQATGPGTATNASHWSIFSPPPGGSGLLKDIQTDAALPVTVALTSAGTITPAATGANPNPGTPLYDTFLSYVDFQGTEDSPALARIPTNASVTCAFRGLDPQKVYSFKGGAVAGGTGGSSALEWSRFQIDGAVSFTNAHTAGCYTNGLDANQVALNTGVNTNGDMVAWEQIVPSADGSFAITMTQYTGPIPTGGTATGSYGYALSGFRLEEVNPRAPAIVSAASFGDRVQLTFSLPVLPATATNLANYALTNLYGEVLVLAATLDTNRLSLELTTGDQLPFMRHWLTVRRLADAETGTNVIGAGSQTIYTNIGFTAGYIKTEFYRGIPGTDIAALTNNPIFPNQPTRVNYYPYSYFWDPSVGANYGCRMSGILVPPMTGDYRFSLHCPAKAMLFLSPTEDPGRKQLIADQNTLSSVISLAAGEHYYLEALSKEGSSSAGSSHYLEVEWNPWNDTNFWLIDGSSLGNYLTAPGATINIAQQPADASVYSERSAAFSVSATSNSKITQSPSYQWQLNGVNIPGATQSYYSTPLLYETNSGCKYRVLVVVPGAAVFSRAAQVTVTRDLDPPTVVQAMNFGHTNVQLVFSEPVERDSATTITNYAFADGTAILAVSLDMAQGTVTLATTPLAYGSNYTLVINGVRDVAMIPNTIATNTVVVVAVTSSTTSDVGKPPTASIATPVGEGLNIVATGSDIGGTNDQFTLSYQLCSGDFDVRARVAGLSASDLWAKAGLMARETLTPGSRFAAALVTPAMNGASFAYRENTNQTAVATGSFTVSYPNTWVRLRRSGSTFAGYASYDGENWASLGMYYLDLSNLLYVGFAVSSHTTNQAATAEFRDLGGVGPNVMEGPVKYPHEALGPSSRKTPIVISEIMYKPAPRADGKNLEFLELYNSNPWFHDIGGYRVVGDNLNYTVPVGTVIPGGSFLVIAASPADLGTVYGISNILGQYTGSLKKADTLRLFDEQGALLLTIPFSDRYPWPVAADGTGHSIILANPTYGEADARAWDISDVVGGSPGQVDSYHPSPLRDVVINELLAHTEDAKLLDYVELYNHSTRTNDLSGCILTDDAQTNKFVIPSGTHIPPGGFVSFDQSELGFALNASGETVYLIKPDGSRILDAVQFEAQADGITFGRWPDGANAFYPLAARTPGAANSDILVGDIVINELMYDPISGNDDDQFIELYNQGTNTVNLANWKVVSGINFTIPTGVTLAPGSYLVLGRNLTNLLAKYPNLSAANTLGNYSGKLSHDGERIALAMPQVLNGTNTVYVLEDEVTYGTGGRWGQWSAGGGSSLELIDPRANHRLAANWADSDDTQKSVWVNIEATGVMDNGSSFGSAFSYAQFGPLDAGECLVDDLEVMLGTDGVNLVKNPGFESGLANWSLQGCMSRSSLEDGGYGGSGHALHVRCSGRIWTGVNSCQAALNSGGLAANKTATLRFKARWLHGWPEVLLRLKGNWLEAVGTMPVPANLGTPGAPNSRSVANAGPAIYEVSHAPTVPTSGQPVVVSARVHDPDGLQVVTLNYRVDPNPNYTQVTMTDDGQAGDTVAGDGVFSATLPGNYGVSAFYVSAQDRRGAMTRFPALVKDNAPAPECVVRFGDDNPGGSFGAYHLWITRTNLDRWISLPNLSNEMHDGTMVNGNRVIYNMKGRFAGSPYHQNFYSPEYGDCHFKWTFPEDDKFLGATSFNKIHAPGNGPGDDDSMQREQAAYTFMRALGVPWLNRRYVAVIVNGNRSPWLMEDTQCPDGDMVKEFFPNDSGGFLYKMQPWFEFGTSTSSSYVDFQNIAWCSILPFNTTGGVKKTARYRYTFEARRTPDSANNYTNVFALIDAAGSTSNYVENVESIADMENWMRVFAANHAAGNWDSFGTQNGQNLYGYIGTHSTKYSLMMFDFNIVLGNSDSWGPGANLFSSSDARLGKMYSTPVFRRMYVRALQELVKGPLDVAKSGPLIDAKYNTFIANGGSVPKTTSIKSWLTSARSSITSQISAQTSAPFDVSPSVVVSNDLAVVTGTAPVNIKSISLNGAEWPVAWTSVTAWSATVPIKLGTNIFNVAGVDRYGQSVPGASSSVTVVIDNTELAPPVLAGARLNSDQFVLTWLASAGQNYQVEYVESLPAANWIPLGDPMATTGSTLAFTNQLTLSTNRFFRLRLVP
jgi:regulation of enolase protein 1 (concanavalin A-like superfamily)